MNIRMKALLASIATAGVLVTSGCADLLTGGGSIAEQGYFHAGGEYTKTKDGQVMVGQMFVQYFVPARRTQPYPVIMWHGGGQTGTNFLTTPDGRKGWADYFLRQGYTVYVVDQPARGRSGYYTDVYGATRRPNTEAMARRFTAPEKYNDYPQAKLHTQWPGKGVAGDPIFDRFFASQVEDIADVGAIERLNRAAGAALLDKIGPAILLTHSQSGPIGWVVADARPKLVKGILSIEPSGPPLHDISVVGAPEWFKDGPVARQWGITREPLAFSPAMASPADLRMTKQAQPDSPDLVRCWLPSTTARELVNLKGIPILMVTSESSYHAPYDHCTSKFLSQMGVKHEFVRLPEIGIRGNGHMMMLEKNSDEVAGVLVRWTQKNVK